MKRPFWAWPDIANRLLGVRKIMCMGTPIEIPVTAETRPIMDLMDGKKAPTWPKRYREDRRRMLIERGLRDIVWAIHIQVRDTVGANVTTELLQEMSDKFRPLVNARVNREIEKRQPLLPEKIE